MTDPGFFVSDNQTFEYTGLNLVTGKKNGVAGLVLNVYTNNGSKFVTAIYQQNDSLARAVMTGDGMPLSTTDAEFIAIVNYMMSTGGYDAPDAYYIVSHSEGRPTADEIYEDAFGEPFTP